MINIKKYFIVTSFISLLLYAACDDAGISPVTEVRGRLVNEYGAPVRDARVKSENSEAMSQADGSFMLNISSATYEIRIIKLGQPNVGFLYKGLSTREPVLTLFGAEGNMNSSDLTVNIPPLSGNERAIVIFTDKNRIQTEAFIVQPNFTVTITVNWVGNINLSGEVIVLIFEFDNNMVTDYKKYGNKITSLSAGFPVTVNFNNADLVLNPQEDSVTGELNVPTGSVSPRTDLLINFTASGSSIFPFTAGSSIAYMNGLLFNLLVPQGLPGNHRFLLGGSVNGSEVYEFSSKTSQVQAGNNSISLESFPKLLEPENFASNVSLNTPFSISSGSGEGVLIYTFDGNDRVFSVVTFDSQIYLPDFSDMGLSIGSEHLYDWHVIKFGVISTMNDFVTGDLQSNLLLKYFSRSTERRFTTRP